MSEKITSILIVINSLYDNFAFNNHISEIFLSFAIISLILFVALIERQKSNKYYIFIHETYILTLIVLFFLICSYLVTCNFESIQIAKIFVSIISFILTIMIYPALKAQRINYSEFFILFLIAILSLLLMLEANNLLTFYLTMEMQALCYYVMSTILRNNVASVEAGLKYFILGCIMSAIYLLGSSLIYGVLGTINLQEMALLFLSLEINTVPFTLLLAILLIIATLFFKIGAFPFHFWIPDVYEGAPIATTTIFSILPKFPFFYFFIKWNISLLFTIDYFINIYLWAGILTTILGTIYSFKQWKFKRLIIFSSIGQVGYLVSNLAICTTPGYMSLFNFLIIYILGSILLWGFYIRTMYIARRMSFFQKREEVPALYISDFMYIVSRKKINIIIFTLIFFSMAAIPPLPGFFQKLFVLNSLTIETYYTVVIIYLILGAYSTFYYLRFIKIAFFDKKQIKNLKFSKNPFILIRTKKDNEDLNHIELLLFLIFWIFIYLSIDNSMLEDFCLLLSCNII